MKFNRRTLQQATAILMAAFLMLSFGAVALAQTETGQITVKATDPQGAVVGGATVSVKSTTTAVARTATTNEEGIAIITALQPGLYEVTVNGAGFAPYKQQANVTVGAKLNIEASLSATAKGETVTVVAGESGVEVNTQTQELSDVISQKQLVELPTITRNPYDLVAISGNVSSGDPNNMTMRGTGFAINGQRSASTNILLDGGENVDAFVAGVGQSVPLDGVQEFRVITSSFSAEYGRASGGIVNVATKAGSNSFHGSLYEFNRMSALASNDFDNNAQGIPKGVFTRNQFGYSAGGRVIKDKLFFFNSTEWTRVRSTGEVISIVPTPELISVSNANTKAFFAPYQLVTPINGTVYSVGTVKSLLGLGGSNAFNDLPSNLPAFGQVRLPRATDLGGGFPQNDWQTVARFDYNWSENTQLYFRSVYEDGSFEKGTINFSPYVGFNTGQTTRNQNYLFNVTHAFAANIVNQSKVVFNRLTLQQPLAEQPPGPTLYINDTVSARLAGFLFRFPGYSATTPGSAIPFGGPQNFLQLYDDVNWTKGSHQLRFGGQYVHIRDNRTFGAYENAVEGLSAAGQSFSTALPNFVNGQLRIFSVAAFPQGKFPCHNDPVTGARIETPDCTLQTPLTSPNFSRSNRYHEWAAYFNDSWKVRPRLTLNLGVRYEYYGTQHNANQALDSNFYLGEGSTIFERIKNGQILLAKDSPIGKLWQTDPNNFAPRVGVAWDVFGNGSTSVRGGYGLAYERNFGNVTFNVIQNPPNNATVAITAGVDVPAGSLPITPNNLGPLAGSGISKSFPAVSLRAVDPNIVNAYAHFWSFAVERQLSPTTVASLEYSGSAGRKLYSISNINRAGTGFAYGGIPRLASRLNNNGATSINFRGSDGRSNYDALIASIESSRLRNWGLRFTGRYTYSRAKDNLSSTFSESNNNANLGYTDPFNPDLDYGFADFDNRHRIVASWTWEVPTPKLTNRVAQHLLGGWELTGIFQARSGSPFTIFDCVNGQQMCSRVLLDGPVSFKGSINHDSVGVSDTPNRYKYIDLFGLHPGAFVDQFGFGSDFPPFPSNMSKRNAFRGPGFWNMDGAAFKNFHLTENVKLQLRLEAYNVFNHANLFISGGEAEIQTGAPVDASGNFLGGGFVPANFFGRRNIQLAGKIIF
ncbi:MAG TPA: TonB-dependent receptor [Blastocatellia bacterium]|nr:TonB-dependent receptor [Blastocatellia bacterium]